MNGYYKIMDTLCKIFLVSKHTDRSAPKATLLMSFMFLHYETNQLDPSTQVTWLSLIWLRVLQ